MTDTTTLLHSLKLDLFVEMNALADLDDWENETPEVRAYYDHVVTRVADSLLAEIERRCAERGYAYVMAYPWYADDEQVVGEPLVDFIAKIRGEIE